jgi:hypothetical protein
LRLASRFFSRDGLWCAQKSADELDDDIGRSYTELGSLKPLTT